MIDFKDYLGPCFIPDALLKQAESYVRPEPKLDAGTPWEIDDGPADWTIVKKFTSSSNSLTVHTVERKGKELRCTCQSFRIQKKGHCKHTQAVKVELGL